MDERPPAPQGRRQPRRAAAGRGAQQRWAPRRPRGMPGAGGGPGMLQQGGGGFAGRGVGGGYGGGGPAVPQAWGIQQMYLAQLMMNNAAAAAAMQQFANGTVRPAFGGPMRPSNINPYAAANAAFAANAAMAATASAALQQAWHASFGSGAIWQQQAMGPFGTAAPGMMPDYWGIMPFSAPAAPHFRPPMAAMPHLYPAGPQFAAALPPGQRIPPPAAPPPIPAPAPPPYPPPRDAAERVAPPGAAAAANQQQEQQPAAKADKPKRPDRIHVLCELAQVSPKIKKRLETGDYDDMIAAGGLFFNEDDTSGLVSLGGGDEGGAGEGADSSPGAGGAQQEEQQHEEEEQEEEQGDHNANGAADNNEGPAEGDDLLAMYLNWRCNPSQSDG